MLYYVAKPLKETNGRYYLTPSLNSNILFVHKVFYGFPICRIELELCYNVHGGNIPSEWLDRNFFNVYTVTNCCLCYSIEHITTRSMVILWLLDLNPMDNATTLLLSNLRERCLSRSAALHTSKPRYYANSEHHRLKLRLIQALAAIVSVDAVWDERFADALLNESNQLNITFILECIIAYTIEPSQLFKLLDQVLDAVIFSKIEIAKKNIFTKFENIKIDFYLDFDIGEIFFKIFIFETKTIFKFVTIIICSRNHRMLVDPYL